MNGFIKRTIIKAAAALLIAAFACFAGCAGKLSAPNEKNKASESPKPAPTQSALPSETAPGGSTLPSDMPSGEPSSSPGDVTGMIEGFMEGMVVDPESVPKLMELLAGNSNYKDMSVQSITYKLFEGRQAYYVVLQGEGDASHPVYVFGDDTIVDE